MKAQDQSKGERVEFKPPEGFVAPEASETGEWDVVCTFRSKPDGTICLVQLGETKMPGYDGGKEARMESKPNYSKYTQGMQGMMGAGGGMASAAPMGGGGASGY